VPNLTMLKTGGAYAEGVEGVYPTVRYPGPGFAKIDQKFSPDVVLIKEGLITLDASGKARGWEAAAWPAGGSCAIVMRDADDEETEAKVNAILANSQSLGFVDLTEA